MNALPEPAPGPDDRPDHPIDWQRVFEVKRQVDKGEISPADGIKALSLGRAHIWSFSAEPDHSPLDLPRWPLRLALSWILHDGDAARVAAAADDARHWRFPLETRHEWWEAYRSLQHALASGKVTASARRRGLGRAPIAAEAWDDLRPILSGSVVILRKDDEAPGSVYYDVRFDAAAIKALWKPVTRAKSASKATIKTKTDAVRSLTAMMRADRENPIPKAKVRAQAAYASMAKRAFDDAWTEAAMAAEAPAWSASGRRPKPRPSSPSPSSSA